MMNLNYLFILVMIFEVMMIFLMMIPSNLFKFHPLLMSVLLIIYVIFYSFKMNMFSSMYWYSYILFLVMVGGLMILFMYFTSLTNNQLFFMDLMYYIYFVMKLMVLMILLCLLIFLFDYFNVMKFFFYEEIMKLNYMFFSFNSLVYKNLLMNYMMDLNLYMIIYLFITMVCSVLICMKSFIPLRQLFLKN